MKEFGPFTQDVLQVLDWIGTFVFAISGGLLGLKKKFDLFGVLVLACVVAVAGGVVRDLLIGAVPPAAVEHVHYLLIALGGGLLTFYAYPKVASLQQQILLFDAVGLAAFAVIGAQKAMAFGIHPVMVAVMGMVTGVGGGMVRDVLAGDIPAVLRSDLYAVAALAAGAIVSAGHVLEIAPLYTTLAGLAVCVFLRLMAMYRGWRIPVAGWR